MKRAAMLLPAIALCVFASTALAQTTVRVAWCARTVSSAAAPFAIATKMGWFAKDGIKVELVPMRGSTDWAQAASAMIRPCISRRASSISAGSSK